MFDGILPFLCIIQKRPGGLLVGDQGGLGQRSLRGKEEIMEKPTPYKKLCKGIELPSDNEVEALGAMRALKLRVREIKKEISEISQNKDKDGAGSITVLENELMALKREWNRLEEKRRNAARERMILLGHDEGD